MEAAGLRDEEGALGSEGEELLDFEWAGSNMGGSSSWGGGLVGASSLPRMGSSSLVRSASLGLGKVGGGHNHHRCL